MKKLLTKFFAGVLLLSACFSFSSCKVGEAIGEKVDKLLFCDIRIEGEPIMTVIEEEDGEYTVIVEGYAKNYSDEMAHDSEAYAYFYGENGEELETAYTRVGRIDKEEVWRFYIKAENLSVKPVDFKVSAYEDM